MVLCEPSLVQVDVHFDSEVDGVPLAFDGYRIVQLSDLHLGTTAGLSRFASIVTTVDKLSPGTLFRHSSIIWLVFRKLNNLFDSELDNLTLNEQSTLRRFYDFREIPFR